MVHPTQTRASWMGSRQKNKRYSLMKDINFNHKKFKLVENTKNGKVNAETIFEYQQEGDLVTANYYGGTIKYGKIIAHLQDDKLKMLYQCLTTDNQLKAGKSIAQISLTKKRKIKLTLDWEWITGDKASGVSEYVEV